MAVAIAALAAFPLGILAGLTIHKARLWCSICGVTMECPEHGRETTA